MRVELAVILDTDIVEQVELRLEMIDVAFLVCEQLFEQIMEQRIAKQKRIRALEEHRGRERQEHEVEQNRAGLKDADDLWLFGRR